MRLKHRTDGILLALTYALLAILFACFLGVGLYKMNETEKELARIDAVSANQTTLIAAMRASVSARVSSLHKLARLTDHDAIRLESDRLVAQENVYTDAMAKLGKTFEGSDTAPEAVALFDKLQETERTALPLLVEAEWLAMRKSVQTRHVLARNVEPQQTIWLDALDELARSEHKRNADAASATHAAFHGAVVLTLLLSACPLAASIAMFLFARRPLRMHPESQAQLAARVAARTGAASPTAAIPARARRRADPASDMRYLRDRIRSVFNAWRTGSRKTANKVAAATPDLSPHSEWHHSIMPSK